MPTRTGPRPHTPYIKIDGVGAKITEHQLEYILNVVGGQKNQKTHGEMASTRVIVVRKIKLETGWDMKPVQLICRFAYKFGLVQL